MTSTWQAILLEQDARGHVPLEGAGVADAFLRGRPRPGVQPDVARSPARGMTTPPSPRRPTDHHGQLTTRANPRNGAQWEKSRAKARNAEQELTQEPRRNSRKGAQRYVVFIQCASYRTRRAHLVRAREVYFRQPMVGTEKEHLLPCCTRPVMGPMTPPGSRLSARIPLTVSTCCV
jgi:hypothetical protein